ncbi:MAG: RecX family transcriptional regulator [Bacilli bacterium]
MKIVKFKKLKNSQYEITLDNCILVIHEDLILSHGLLLTHEISEPLLANLQKENLIYEGYNTALKSIKTKLRSPLEIKSLLTTKGYQLEQIERIITMLKNQGYLDDKLYTNAFIHDKMLLTLDGPHKIIKCLENKGFEKDLIAVAITCFTESEQIARINKVITKSIKTNHNKSHKQLIENTTMKLLNLGYDKNLITSVLSNYLVDDTSIKKKEYIKIYNKLSKKYTGSELEYKIRQKMYQKGFSNYEE